MHRHPSGAASTAEVLRRLRDGLTKAKAGETVFGSVGWRAPLARNDLDQLSTGVPIVALRGRRGAAVMNSAALKKAGIAKEMQSYMGREIPKDSNGELTGELPDFPAGLYAIDKVVPLPVDIAQGGNDRTVIAARYGGWWPSMPAQWRAAPASRQASRARRSTVRRSMPARCRAPRRAVPPRPSTVNQLQSPIDKPAKLVD
jgi:predicted amidohydrolase YtcJ